MNVLNADSVVIPAGNGGIRFELIYLGQHLAVSQAREVQSDSTTQE